MRIAAVDIGTNSTRLLISEYKNGNYNVLERDLIVTRLGEGVDKNKYLKKEYINIAIPSILMLFGKNLIYPELGRDDRMSC